MDGSLWLGIRRASREVFRLVRNSVSSLNQNLQENLSGIQVVQLSGSERKNLDEYTSLNKQNRRQEYRSINLSTFYGAFNDSLTSIGLGLIIWFGAGEVVQDEMTIGGVILFANNYDNRNQLKDLVQSIKAIKLRIIQL